MGVHTEGWPTEHLCPCTLWRETRGRLRPAKIFSERKARPNSAMSQGFRPQLMWPSPEPPHSRPSRLPVLAGSSFLPAPGGSQPPCLLQSDDSLISGGWQGANSQPSQGPHSSDHQLRPRVCGWGSGEAPRPERFYLGIQRQGQGKK